MVKVLNEVVTLLERSRRYELCLEVLHLLAAIYKRDRSYASLKVWAQRYAQICDNLVNVVRVTIKYFILILPRTIDKRR